MFCSTFLHFARLFSKLFSNGPMSGLVLFLYFRYTLSTSKSTLVSVLRQECFLCGEIEICLRLLCSVWRENGGLDVTASVAVRSIFASPWRLLVSFLLPAEFQTGDLDQPNVVYRSVLTLALLRCVFGARSPCLLFTVAHLNLPARHSPRQVYLNQAINTQHSHV